MLGDSSVLGSSSCSSQVAHKSHAKTAFISRQASVITFDFNPADHNMYVFPSHDTDLILTPDLVIWWAQRMAPITERHELTRSRPYTPHSWLISIATPRGVREVATW